jgi:RHS repeat-associated protein
LNAHTNNRSLTSAGNRTTEISTPTGEATTTDVLGYPSTSNRVVQITRGAQTVRQMTYHAAGNLLTDGGNAYTYNNRNRMASATIGAIVWNYTYNGKEQLAIRAKVSPAATTHFIHDLWGNVLAETNGTAAGTTREYIWLPEVEIAPADGARSQVDRPIAVVNAVSTATPATWYVSVDHLNRPIKMTDAVKTSVWDAVWQPWGGVHSITGTASLDARLPGQWFQAETGLHYNWHRQYDPTVGRYTQPDPLGFVDGPSVYGYVGGLPQQSADFDGLARKTTPPAPPTPPPTPTLPPPATPKAGDSPPGPSGGSSKLPPGSAPTCSLSRAFSPGSPLNPICKTCMKCIYACKSGGAMFGGGQQVTRFQKGSACIVLTGPRWVPGYLTEAACEMSSGDSSNHTEGTL